MLDVGCGQVPRGDVNVDKYLVDISGKRTSVHRTLDTKNIPNFVLADGCHLPFRDGAFKVVRCGHVIEHEPNPYMLLRELARVSSYSVEVEYPHRLGERIQIFNRMYSRSWMKKHHINHLSPKWFGEQASDLGCTCSNTVLSYVYFPHEMMPWVKLPFFVKSTLCKLSGENLI